MTCCKYEQQFQICKAPLMVRNWDWNKTTMIYIYIYIYIYKYIYIISTKVINNHL